MQRKKEKTNETQIYVLMENSVGVVSRIASLFHRLNQNIEALRVGQLDKSGLARMVIEINGEKRHAGLLAKQMGRLIDVLGVKHVDEQSNKPSYSSVIRVFVKPEKRPHVMEMANRVSAGVVESGNGSLFLEVKGTKGKMESLKEELKPYGPSETISEVPEMINVNSEAELIWESFPSELLPQC